MYGIIAKCCVWLCSMRGAATYPKQQRTLLREQLEATDKLSVLVGELINMNDGLVTSRPPSNSNEDEL